MLTLLLSIPLVGIIIILLVKAQISRNYQFASISPMSSTGIIRNKLIDYHSNQENSNSNLNSNSVKTMRDISLIKNIGLITSIITLAVSIIIWYEFDGSNPEMQFIEEVSPFFSFLKETTVNNFEIRLAIDGISLYFILLTTIIIPITILSDWGLIPASTFDKSRRLKDISSYIIIILLLEILLLAVFMVTDLLLFYISFEATLPPLFILIGYFGSGNRIRASYYLLLYTLIGSLFLLLAILTIYFLTNSLDYKIVLNSNISFEIQTVLWLAMFISFAVKTPLFPFHIWLNLAHSEAPLGGSILLASIILKLALYGFLRIVIPMLPLASLYFTPFVYTISVLTIIWASLTTLRQIDTKRIVAYSSIAHVAVSVLGAFSNTIIGIEGSIILGLAHGLVSPALFIIVGGILYSRYHTRMINYYRGLITYYPLISLYFFLFTLANCGVPLTANFIGEFLSLCGAFNQNPICTALAATSIVLSAGYSFWLWSRISTNSFSKYLKVTPDLTRREFYILTSLLILTVLVGVYPNFILKDLHYSVSNILITIS